MRWFKRKDSIVTIEIDSELGTCTPVYMFSFDCSNNQEYAEMLTNQMNKVLEKWKVEIAKEAYMYLSEYETSQLKKKLRDWNSREGYWK